MPEFVLSQAAQDESRFAERLRAGHSILFKPQGSSMDPAIADGTIVMVDPMTRPPLPGEVVLARDALGARYVLHRVSAVRSNRLYLWGDNVDRGDGWFALDDLLGIARVPKASGWYAAKLALRRGWFGILNVVR